MPEELKVVRWELDFSEGFRGTLYGILEDGTRVNAATGVKFPVIVEVQPRGVQVRASIDVVLMGKVDFAQLNIKESI